MPGLPSEPVLDCLVFLLLLLSPSLPLPALQVAAARKSVAEANERCAAYEARAVSAERFARHLHLAGSELARVYEENDVLRTRQE